MKKSLVLLISVFLLVSILMTGCSKEGSSDNTPASDSSASPSAASASPTAEVKAAPDKIRIFYITSGLTIPDNFNYKNNFVLDEIAKLANVEIEEAVVPPYSDYKTKFNLMMSSGNICDVVHIPAANEVNTYGQNGALMELTDTINGSDIMKKRYSAKFTELLKANDGKIYSLRSLPVDGDCNLFGVRYDLLESVGYASMPATMEEWLDAMRKVKAKYPDSIPYTSRENLHYCEFVFKSYGCASDGVSWQYYKGKIIPAFENPLYKDALKIYQTMLTEGLMDKEFVTSKAQDFQDKRLNKNVLINQQNLTALATWIDRFTSNNITGAMFVPGQFPKINDDRIDPIAVYDGPPSIGAHCVAISSTSKKKEAAVRFLEALLSDECNNLTVWGREGIEYNVVNGEKVPDYVKASETNWRLMYGMLFGFNTKEELELLAKTNIANTKYESAGKEKYQKLFLEQADKALGDLNSVQMNPYSLITLDKDTVTRLTEATNEARTITVKAMIGEISMTEFDAQAASFMKKYQFITDEYNAKLPEAQKKAAMK